MFRKINAVIIMIFVLGLVGCRACYSPYDTCQPTFNPDKGDRCYGELYRSGSVLGGAKRTTNEKAGCKTCGGDSDQAGGDELLQFDSTPMQPMREEVKEEVQSSVENNVLNEGQSIVFQETLRPSTDIKVEDFSLGAQGNEFPVGGNTEELPAEAIQKRR